MVPLPRLNTIGLRNDFRSTGQQALGKLIPKRQPLGDVSSSAANSNKAGPGGGDGTTMVKAAGKPSPHEAAQGTWGFAMLAPEHQKGRGRQGVVGDAQQRGNDPPKVSPTLASSPHLQPKMAMGSNRASLSILEMKRKAVDMDAVSQSTSSLPPWRHAAPPHPHDLKGAIGGGNGGNGGIEMAKRTSGGKHRYDSIAPPAGKKRVSAPFSTEDDFERRQQQQHQQQGRAPGEAGGGARFTQGEAMTATPRNGVQPRSFLCVASALDVPS